MWQLVLVFHMSSKFYFESALSHFFVLFSVFTLCTLQEVMIPRNFSHVTFLCLVFVSTYLNVLAAENTENQDGERLKRSYGKRITPHLVAELGKRPKELYSFGIGKKWNEFVCTAKMWTKSTGTFLSSLFYGKMCILILFCKWCRWTKKEWKHLEILLLQFRKAFLFLFRLKGLKGRYITKIGHKWY